MPSKNPKIIKGLKDRHISQKQYAALPEALLLGIIKKIKGGKKKAPPKANTSRMNKLEELGRVDAEKGKTLKGKRNLKDEKKRIIKELSKK
tara:strand:+ start:1171 stop:1443 length:273 start_codon:yes stop_codon:yes gene_type:complete